jgi:hypothetical protein
VSDGLAGEIAQLVERLRRADEQAFWRMAEVVGDRRARIQVDGEAVDVQLRPDGQVVTDVATTAAGVDGEGSTDRATVLALLAGELEVSDALVSGRVSVTGTADAVERILHAIEILLDVSARGPALQAQASRYEQGQLAGSGRKGPPRAKPGRPLDWGAPGEDELALLSSLGLMENLDGQDL